MVEFIDCEPAATEDQIRELERSIGFSLPARLRGLFLESNGGHPVPNVFRDGVNDADVEELLALHGGRASVQAAYDVLVRSKMLVPRHFVPFARTPAGDCFFVDCGSPGQLVYLYRH